MPITTDYSIFYKKKLEIEDIKTFEYDLFISAYNDSKRVTEIFKEVNSKEKHWLILPEYGYEGHEMPSFGTTFSFNSNDTESVIIGGYFQNNNFDFENGRLCIDITGFIRPHLVFLIRFLAQQGIRNVDFLYTDPVKYKDKDETVFSDESDEEEAIIRQIDGCGGSHNTQTNNDILIIGAGYDHKRIIDIAKSKLDAKKIQVFGFPSLQADMYQENILRAYKAEEDSSTGRNAFIDSDHVILAPANDPFVTANQLSQFIQKENSKQVITNIYLSPLSTKAQTLGFALYFVGNCLNDPVSIIFPFSKKYSRETTEGIAKIWKYTVEFEALRGNS
jgi:hypothetical protein